MDTQRHYFKKHYKEHSNEHSHEHSPVPATTACPRIMMPLPILVPSPRSPVLFFHRKARIYPSHHTAVNRVQLSKPHLL